MNLFTQRAISLVGGGLIAFGTAVAVAPGAAADGDYGDYGKKYDRCTVELYEDYGYLKVKIDGPKDAKGDYAKVSVDFNSNRGDEDRKVKLGYKGDATVKFHIPNKAKKAEVEVQIGYGKDKVTCEDKIKFGKKNY